MAKNKKMVDLKPQEGKINEAQLKVLQNLVKGINDSYLVVGSLEVQKLNEITRITSLQKDLNDFQKTLNEEYGNVNVSINDGSYKVKEDESDPKN
jgi:hypothetical protein